MDERAELGRLAKELRRHVAARGESFVRGQLSKRATVAPSRAPAKLDPAKSAPVVQKGL